MLIRHNGVFRSMDDFGCATEHLRRISSKVLLGA
jgi:hypothetical protein